MAKSLSDLPDEVLQQVYDQLLPPDKAALRMSCKYFHTTLTAPTQRGQVRRFERYLGSMNLRIGDSKIRIDEDVYDSLIRQDQGRKALNYLRFSYGRTGFRWWPDVPSEDPELPKWSSVVIGKNVWGIESTYRFSRFYCDVGRREKISVRHNVKLPIMDEPMLEFMWNLPSL